MQAIQAGSQTLPITPVPAWLAVVATGLLLILVCLTTVILWRRRFRQSGVGGLGSPPGLPPGIEPRLAASPKLGAALWSAIALALGVSLSFGYFLGTSQIASSLIVGLPSPVIGLLIRVVFFGALTTTLFVLFIRESLREDQPRIDTHWGGFGGALGGWTVSRSLVYLGAAVLFGALMALTSYPTSVEPQQDGDQQETSNGTSTSRESSSNGDANTGKTSSKDGAAPESQNEK